MGIIIIRYSQSICGYLLLLPWMGIIIIILIFIFDGLYLRNARVKSVQVGGISSQPGHLDSISVFRRLACRGRCNIRSTLKHQPRPPDWRKFLKFGLHALFSMLNILSSWDHNVRLDFFFCTVKIYENIKQSSPHKPQNILGHNLAHVLYGQQWLKFVSPILKKYKMADLWGSETNAKFNHSQSLFRMRHSYETYIECRCMVSQQLCQVLREFVKKWLCRVISWLYKAKHL